MVDLNYYSTTYYMFYPQFVLLHKLVIFKYDKFISKMKDRGAQPDDLLYHTTSDHLWITSMSVSSQ